MIQKIKAHLVTTLALLALMMVPSAAFATTHTPVPCNTKTSGKNTISNQLTAGANSTTSGDATDCTKDPKANESSITNIAKSIVNILSLIIGAIAVIMIIIGGFKYITSSGDSNRVGSAKNTIIYALIGLVIVALAQIIVKFVLNQTDSVIT